MARVGGPIPRDVALDRHASNEPMLNPLPPQDPHKTSALHAERDGGVPRTLERKTGANPLCADFPRE